MILVLSKFTMSRTLLIFITSCFLTLGFSQSLDARSKSKRTYKKTSAFLTYKQVKSLSPVKRARYLRGVAKGLARLDRMPKKKRNQRKRRKRKSAEFNFVQFLIAEAHAAAQNFKGVCGGFPVQQGQGTPGENRCGIRQMTTRSGRVLDCGNLEMCNPVFFGLIPGEPPQPVCHRTASTEWCLRNTRVSATKAKAGKISTDLDLAWAELDPVEWNAIVRDIDQICQGRATIQENASDVAKACGEINIQKNTNQDPKRLVKNARYTTSPSPLARPTDLAITHGLEGESDNMGNGYVVSTRTAQILSSTPGLPEESPAPNELNSPSGQQQKEASPTITPFSPAVEVNTPALDKIAPLAAPPLNDSYIVEVFSESLKAYSFTTGQDHCDLSQGAQGVVRDRKNESGKNWVRVEFTARTWRDQGCDDISDLFKRSLWVEEDPTSKSYGSPQSPVSSDVWQLAGNQFEQGALVEISSSPKTASTLQDPDSHCVLPPGTQARIVEQTHSSGLRHQTLEILEEHRPKDCNFGDDGRVLILTQLSTGDFPLSHPTNPESQIATVGILKSGPSAAGSKSVGTGGTSGSETIGMEGEDSNDNKTPRGHSTSPSLQFEDLPNGSLDDLPYSFPVEEKTQPLEVDPEKTNLSYTPTPRVVNPSPQEPWPLIDPANDLSFGKFPTFQVNATDLSFRAGPGSRYQKLQTLNHPELVHPTGQTDGNWFEVRFNGQTGWVYDDNEELNYLVDGPMVEAEKLSEIRGTESQTYHCENCSQRTSPFMLLEQLLNEFDADILTSTGPSFIGKNQTIRSYNACKGEMTMRYCEAEGDSRTKCSDKINSCDDSIHFEESFAALIQRELRSCILEKAEKFFKKGFPTQVDLIHVGDYVNRTMRTNSNRWSRHAYGKALDIRSINLTFEDGTNRKVSMKYCNLSNPSEQNFYTEVNSCFESVNACTNVIDHTFYECRYDHIQFEDNCN